MTRGRAIAGALGLVAIGAAVWWFARPTPAPPQPPMSSTEAVTAAPTVRPQSPTPGPAPVPDEGDNPPLTAEQRARMEALEDYRAWLAERLAAEDTARSLALAVHLLAPAFIDPERPADNQDPRIPRWFARARAIAGDDGVAWAMLVTVAGRRLHDAPEPSDATVLAWAEHDPHNLAPWTHLSPDAARPGEWFDRARSPQAHFTSYWLDTEAAVMAAYRRYPPPPPWRDMLLGKDGWTETGPPLGLALPIDLPAFQRLMAVCAPRDRSVRPPPSCAPLGRALATRSDTLVAGMIGLAVARRMGDGQLPADLHAAERTSRWLQAQFLGLDHDATLMALGDYLREPPPLTEHGFFVFTLERAGIRTTPPAGWNPPARR